MRWPDRSWAKSRRRKRREDASNLSSNKQISILTHIQLIYTYVYSIIFRVLQARILRDVLHARSQGSRVQDGQADEGNPRQGYPQQCYQERVSGSQPDAKQHEGYRVFHEIDLEGQSAKSTGMNMCVCRNICTVSVSDRYLLLLQ